MKKVFTFFLAMAIIFGISGCGKKEYIVFPFSASDVVKIETYYSNSEADTKEKTLTEEADIDYLYTFFSELPVKDANSDSTNDGSTIKFVFDLSDGTNYELVTLVLQQKRDTYNLKLLIFIILHLLTSLVFGQTYLRCGLTFNNPYDWKQLSTKNAGRSSHHRLPRPRHLLLCV